VTLRRDTPATVIASVTNTAAPATGAIPATHTVPSGVPQGGYSSQWDFFDVVDWYEVRLL
jgi:hypothetical protein